MMHVLHNQLVSQTSRENVTDDNDNGDDGNKEANDEMRATVKYDTSLETPTRKIKPSKRKLKRTIKQTESTDLDRKRSKINVQS